MQQKTVYRRLCEEGFSLKNKYAELSVEELDSTVQQIKGKFPNAGSQMVQGYLQAEGHHVQRQRVRDSLKRVDPEGCAERWSAAVHRRKYHVATPNTLWHMDGHMKLIRWGFSTHGCVDGFSRLITFLRCGTDNTASTVLNLFVKACVGYGVPSRVRSDHGGENTKVELFLNLIRDRTDGSHPTGRSIHNQRIERLWRDVHTNVTSEFYSKFYEMENDPVIQLDPEDHVHRLALTYIYLSEINARLEEFQQGCNFHKMRTESQQSPQQIWLSGMLDRMDSNHTATNEVFGDIPSLDERLEQSLSRFGVTLENVEDDGTIPDQVLRYQLSVAQKEVVDRELQGIIDLKERFVKCI